MEQSPRKTNVVPLRQGPEALLRSLLRGKYSSLSLAFNEHHINHWTAADAAADGREFEATEWVSEEERRLAIEQDSVWTLQWYPDTPIGLYRIAASSMDAILAYVRDYELKREIR